MTPQQILYIDTTKPAPTALVRSITDNTPAHMNDCVYGDLLQFAVIFVTNKAVDAFSGQDDVQITASIGKYGGPVYCQGTSFVASASYGFTGSLEVTGSALSSSLVGYDNNNSVFSIKYWDTAGDGGKRTCVLTPILVWSDL